MSPHSYRDNEDIEDSKIVVLRDTPAYDGVSACQVSLRNIQPFREYTPD